MRLLFATSGVGLGHVVRDVNLARHMPWAEIDWISSGIAVKYLEERGERIHNLSLHLCSLNPVIERAFSTGRLKLGLGEMVSLYRCVRRNVRLLERHLSLGEYDGVVGDEFWELLLSRKSHDKIAFITDFIRFKPQRRSLSQRLILPYVNSRLQEAYRKVGCRIYVGLRGEEDAQRAGFEYYGQIFSHGPVSRGQEADRDLAVINIGGTWAGKTLVAMGREAATSFGLDVQIIGPGPYFNPNPLPLISSARVMITIAGYSSLLEAARLRKRAVIVPLGGDFEQHENAQAFEGRAGYRVIPMDELSSRGLREAISTVLDEEPDPPDLVDGSCGFARRLGIFFDSHQRQRTPAPVGKVL